MSGFTSSGDDDAAGVSGTASATTTAETYGVNGTTVADADASAGTYPAGVKGKATGTGEARGVWGVSRSIDGRGVYGEATADSGVTVGIVGETQSSSDSASGVYGKATAGSGETVGVYGLSESSQGAGVVGHASSSSGSSHGVVGSAESSEGYGLYSFDGAKVEGTIEATERSIEDSGISVYLSDPLTVSANSSRVIEFDQVRYDDWGNYDTSLGEFPVPADGRYRVTASAVLEADGASANLRIQVNDTDKAFNQQLPGGLAAFPNPSVEKTLDLSYGDRVNVEIGNGSDNSADLGVGEPYTYMTIDRIA